MKATKNIFDISMVGIDVETTALDPTKGEIIEVAAVKYSWSKSKPGTSKSEQVQERLVRLCKPKQPISAEITALTGITNEMVEEAPSFQEVREELQSFISTHLVFAHNASFDVAWLTYNGLSLEANRILDTFMIASVAWPEAESYNLEALFQSVGPEPRKIPPMAGSRGAHSALYDVEMAWQVLQAARKELVASPVTYKRIMELLERTGMQQYAPLFSKVPGPASAKASTSAKATVDRSAAATRTISSVLGPDGILSQSWSGFISRPAQLRMAEAVDEIVKEGGIALLEAPTGSGKTVAYLVPIFLYGGSGTSKTVISTHTKHLQDQLIAHDVPQLQEALGSHFNVAVLKGRRNYVCIRRLNAALERAQISSEEAWLLIKTLLWLEKGGSGDLDRLNLSHQRGSFSWHADSLVCRRSCGRSQEAVCPYQLAWRAAEAAEILIVNHALLSDPQFTARWPIATIIFDEAHHVEDALRQATAVSLQPWYLQDLLGPLLHGGDDPAKSRLGRDRGARHLRVEATDLLSDYQQLLQAMGDFTSTHTAKTWGGSSLRLVPNVRQSSQWGRIEKMTDHWVGRAQFICGLLEAQAGLPPVVAKEAIEIRASLHELSRHILRFVTGDAERIQWIETDEQNTHVYLHDLALSIVPSLQRLYGAVRGVVFTSATLTTTGNFSYMKDLLGITSATEVVLPSSFPLPDNLLIYVVDDAPDPRSPGYDDYVARHLLDSSLILGGRTLGLFTSFKSVSAVFKQLIRPLNKEQIKLYAQGHSGGKTIMIKRFRDQPRSVLLGTDSFWEGIDVPGDTLSCVVIAKLPFAPPHDPVVEACAETRGMDSFSSFGLPRMILKLRQGIGRLIRRQSDRGVVVIFDSRLQRSSYGDEVIKSLPAGRIKIGSAADLAAAISGWIGKEIIAGWDHGKEGTK